MNFVRPFLPLLAFFAATAFAGDSATWWENVDSSALPEKTAKIETVIDHYLAEKCAQSQVTPASLASEETLIRRLTLDLVGRIPTPPEFDAFINAESPHHWAETIEKLLKQPGFERFLAHELNWLVHDGKNDDFRNYLLRAVENDVRWDQIFSDVIRARPESDFLKGIDSFVKGRIKDHDKLTNDVSVRFFGVNVSCAQCHDHPYVDDWTQDTYYGMKSFFNRSFENGGFVAEREYGLVTYKTTAGEERQPTLRFLGAPTLNEPEHKEPTAEEKKAEKKLFDELKAKKELPPSAKYSRRVRAIEAGLSGENEMYFARSLVNRIWNRFFGRGLVMPLDQMHGQNPPSHPELLQWLAQDLIDHDYDLRRLIRGIAMSQGYQRSSQWSDQTRPTGNLFAVMEPRALTPRQYGISIRIATGNPSQFRADIASPDWEKQIEQTERSGEGLARWFERPDGTFHFAVDEALYFSNSSDSRNQILNGGLVSFLANLKTSEEQIESAYLTVLSRLPKPDELQLFHEYLTARSTDSTEALGQMVWALVTSSEARFNH